MFSLPRNVWILAITFSFAMSGISLIVFLGGLIGAQLTPKAEWATLPSAAFIVGSALMTIPAISLMKRYGRKKGGYIGLLISLFSAVICILGINTANFYIFVSGASLIGVATAFYHQFRFAALESLESSNDSGPALSLILLFSILGAIMGPELGTLGKDLIPNTQTYTGSFLLFGLMIVLAMLVFSLFQNTPIQAIEENTQIRPLSTIVKQPIFITALLSSAIGYAVMSFLMTSTPISMHHIQGHSLHDAKWVIQSHLIAMFLPSLFSGYLIKRFGEASIMLIGACLYFAVVIIATQGQALMHYWWALVLLGIGWNFLFLTGTSLLPKSYSHAERYKVQSFNDFSVFSIQAIASLSAAWILFNFGWNIQLLICLPLIVIVIIAALILLKKNRVIQTYYADGRKE